jgi:hypothetical protein
MLQSILTTYFRFVRLNRALLANKGAVALTLLAPLLFTTVAQAHNPIRGWSSELPVSRQETLEFLKYEASYYSFDTDEGRCGGTMSSPELVAYTAEPGLDVDQTPSGDEDTEADPRPTMKIRFELSKAKSYCAFVEVYTCVATVAITEKPQHVSDPRLEITRLKCKSLDQKR